MNQLKEESKEAVGKLDEKIENLEGKIEELEDEIDQHLETIKDLNNTIAKEQSATE